MIEIRQWRNFVFIPILSLLTVFNGVSYYGLMTNQLNWMNNGLYAAVILVAVIVALLGGRVIPFFTERATKWQKKSPIPVIEYLSFASLLALVLSLF